MQDTRTNTPRGGLRSALCELRRNAGLALAAVLLVAAGVALPAMAAPAAENSSAPAEASAAPASTGDAAASAEETSASTVAPADADAVSASAATAPSAPAKAPAPAEPDYKFVAKWGNPFNATTTGYEYENPATLSFGTASHPLYNRPYVASVDISFNLTDTGNVTSLPAGSVTVSAPSSLFVTWDSDTNTYVDINKNPLSPLSQFQTQVPAAPAVADTTSFNYAKSNDGSRVIATNAKVISGSKADNFLFNYHFIPTVLSVDAQGNYEKTFDVTLSVDKDLDGNADFTQTVTLTVKVHTEAKPPELTIKRLSQATPNPVEDTYLTWQQSWGPRPADADDYFYVAYAAQIRRFGTTTESSSQPFTYTFENVGSAAGEGGQLVGAWTADQKVAFSDLAHMYQGLNLTTLSGLAKDWEGRMWSDGAAKTSPIVYEGIQSSLANSPWSSQTYLELGGTYNNKISSGNAGGWKAFVLLMRYPNTLITDAKAHGVDMEKQGIDVHNTVKVTQTSKDNPNNPAEPHRFEASATTAANILLLEKGDYGYRKYTYLKSGGKNLNDTDARVNYGGQSALDAGKKAEVQGGFWGTDSFTHVADSGPVRPTWDKDAHTYSCEPRTMVISERGKILSTGDGRGRIPGTTDKLIDPINLSDDDYRYTKVTIGLQEYDAVYSQAGVWERMSSPSKDYANQKPVSLYIRHAGQNNFEFFQDVNVRGTAQVALPDDVVDVRVSHESSYYESSLSLVTTEVLLPSKRVRDYVHQNIKDGKETYYTAPADYKLMEGKTADQAGDLTARRLSGVTASTDDEHNVYITYRLNQISRNSSVLKTASAVTDIPDKAKQRVTYTVMTFNNMGNLGDGMNLRACYSEDEGLMGKYAISSGVFWDLLPAGTTLDTSSIEVGRWHYPNTQHLYVPFDASYYDVETIPNYQGSGLTMLKVTLKGLPPEESAYSVRNDDGKMKYTGYDAPTFRLYLRFDLVNSYANIRDRGADVLNTVAFVNTSKGEWDPAQIDFSKTDNPETYHYFTSLADAVRDAKTGDTVGFGLTHRPVSFKPINVTEAGTEQQVRNVELDQTFEDAQEGTSDVYTDSSYQYRLAYYQERASKGTQIVFYDTLENGADAHGGSPAQSSAWRGHFRSVDLSAIAGRTSFGKTGANDHARPVLYYATTVPGEADTDLSNTQVWTKYEGTDDFTQMGASLPETTKNAIRAIAIDASKTKGGDDFVLAPGSALVAYINMDSPTKDEAANDKLDGKLAVNQHRVRCVNATGGANPLTNDLYAASSVKLHTVNLGLTKSSDPASGTQDAPAKIKNEQGEPIAYTITVTNKNDTLPLANVKVSDPIPEGLDIDEGNITASGTDKDGNALTQGMDEIAASRTRDGRTLAWTIPSLEPGQSISFTVPTSLAQKADKPQRFDNTAQVTSVRGQDVKLVSETTHHMTEPLVDVHATKTWAGGVEGDHGEVTLQLLRSVDGGEPEPVGESVTTSGLSATWEGVSTYDAQGRKYAYSVAELSATGERLAEGGLRGDYRVSYGTNAEDGTLTVTNSYVEPPANPPANPSEPTLPRTGDVSLAAPYVLTAFGLALALAGVLRKKGGKA
ncbi:Cna B-type domain-containing protein [Olsenella massiliensis]|uniref:Cna B-type domain-containing protein n=1 Tax=Olsenella massiliensis TaxID=1622075 RepID=UPI000B3167F0|nr:Cna B-type domain-containing protein [Olsenella massiliensis]